MGKYKRVRVSRTGFKSRRSSMNNTASKKMNLFKKGQKTQTVEDPTKYLIPKQENSYPRNDQVLPPPTMTTAEYLNTLHAKLEDLTTKEYIGPGQRTVIYGQYMTENQLVKNIMENYRKLASIVKTNDKTWGRLNEYIRAGDVTKPQKLAILQLVLQVQSANNYGAVANLYTQIKGILDTYFYTKQFKGYQMQNLGLRMEQNPYSRVAGVANVNNGFIDFKGGLKQVQITPDPFY